MVNPCNSNYYDYPSECADYDQLTSEVFTSTTTSTITTTTTTTTIAAIPAEEEATFWSWLGPVLGLTAVTGLGLTFRYAESIRRFFNGSNWMANAATELIERVNHLRGPQQGDTESRPNWTNPTPPPSYRSNWDSVSVVSETSQQYQSFEFDSDQDSFPLESVSTAPTPPSPPGNRYLNDRTIYNAAGETDEDVSALIQGMFAGEETTMSSERDLSSPDPDRRESSMTHTNNRAVSMDFSSIHSGDVFEDATDDHDEPPREPTPQPRRGLFPRSTRNPFPKYN